MRLLCGSNLIFFASFIRVGGGVLLPVKDFIIANVSYREELYREELRVVKSQGGAVSFCKVSKNHVEVLFIEIKSVRI